MRRWRAFATLVMFTVLLAPPAGAQEAPPAEDPPVEEPTEETAAEKDGWWYRANTANSTPLGSPPVPIPSPPSTVPADAIAVGAVAGDPDKVAAVGITLAAAEGATIERFTMTLKEIGSPSATSNAANAEIVACPILSFWAGGSAGPWDTQPEADCSLAEAPGTRNDDGTWTFDLSEIGAIWLDPFGGIARDGVVLMEKVDRPTTFQVSFASVAVDGIAVDLLASGGGPEEDPLAPDAGGSAPAGGDAGGVPVDTGGGVDTGGSFDSGGGGVGGATVGVPVDDVAAPPAATPSDTGTIPLDPGGAEPAAATGDTAAADVAVLGDLPLAAVLLVPIALAAAIAMLLALGPAGQPAAHTRERGVSRALAARERTSARATGRPAPVG